MFGARGTGKSLFISQQFLKNPDLPDSKILKIDFLDPEMEAHYSKEPMSLFQQIRSTQKTYSWVFLDEVQKVPKILNVVHKAIEELKVKFILTGSSSRKLRRGGANLLAGRAYLNSLFPLSFLEWPQGFDLNQVLRWGSLPTLISTPDESDKAAYLKSYCQVYLREEIRLEQVLRKIDPFRAFLEVAAQMSGKIINFSKIGHEVGVDHKTVQNYFQILEETYLGWSLPAFHQSVRKSQKSNPKFYLFDLGVRNSLAGNISSSASPGTSFFGELFEQLIVQEVVKLNEYFQKDFRISYLATKNNLEIDLILSRFKSNIAVEIKSSTHIDESAVRKFELLAQDVPEIKQLFFVSQHPVARRIGSVQCLHWTEWIKNFEKL